MSNVEIAELIRERIGEDPVPFESVREIALEIYQNLGGTDGDNFEDIYSILIATLPLTHGTAIIDDNDISTGKTWSSAKIDASLLQKADTSYVNGQLALKADKSELNVKADKSYVDASLGRKQDTLIAGTNITIENNVISAAGGEMPEGYAKIADVDASLALKADKTELNDYVKNVSLNEYAKTNDLSIYATIQNVDASLLLKANSTDLARYATIENVDASLANYATKNDISTFVKPNDLSIYATIVNVDASLANKADKSQLNDYATITNVDASLANKANTSYVEMTFAKVVILTLQQYTDLQVKDSSTLYIISDN